MKTVNYMPIAGRNVEIQTIPESDLKGITLGDKLCYGFYEGEFRGVRMLFLKPKGDNPSPKNCALAADRLGRLFGMPVVFILNPTPTYERQRLFDKDVYFVMSDKYVNLPMTITLERVPKKKAAEKMTPVAQYLLLYHLQIGNLSGLPITEVAKLVPYSYASVSIGITCLCDLGLCEKERQGQRAKVVVFNLSNRELWERAAGYTINPVEKTIFCDRLESDNEYPVCGINALSHYSMLNSDRERWVAMTAESFRSLVKDNNLTNPNEYDGETIIEIWKYPPVSALGNPPAYVDRLSLALSLKGNEDPRVEGEVERMINDIKW